MRGEQDGIGVGPALTNHVLFQLYNVYPSPSVNKSHLPFSRLALVCFLVSSVDVTYAQWHLNQGRTYMYQDDGKRCEVKQR